MTNILNSETPLNIAIIGASGGIGKAFIDHLKKKQNIDHIHAFSRKGTQYDHPKITNGKLDFNDESTIEAAAKAAAQNAPLDLIIVATGILHDQDIQPEKAMRDINADNFAKIFQINTTGPALVAKYFLKHIHKDKPSVFAALSARVGSIEDNVMGGWYAYRASKAALNMLLKNAAIETARRYKKAAIIGLHPGTVDTALSEPFSGNVPNDKLFTPQYATEKMLEVIGNITPEDTGKLIAYDGKVLTY